MRVVSWIFTTYMGIHQYRGLIQCTLDDSADKTNVYSWKIYMYLPCKFGGKEKIGKHRKQEIIVILQLTKVLINMSLIYKI